MSKLFISYRRSDTGYQPEIIKSTLSKYIDDDIIFYDHDIQPTENFVQVINDRLETAKVMLVLIGKDWLNVLKEREKQKDHIDFVKLEIERGLEKEKLDNEFSIFPVLFEGAKMPNENDLPESIRGLSKINAMIIGENEFLPKLHQLGAQLCKKLNGQAICFFKKYRWYLLGCVMMIISSVFGYQYWKDEPSCDDFNTSLDLKILIVPDNNSQYDNMQTILMSSLEPFQPCVKMMEGKYQQLSLGELEEVTKQCKPEIMIKGTNDNSCMMTFEQKLKDYIMINYNISPKNFSQCNTTLDRLGCILNTFLSEKRNNDNVTKNPYCIQLQFNEIALKSEIMDTVDMMIGQSLAHVYEKSGQLDSALLILEKLSPTGGLNPDTVYARMDRIAQKTNNTSAEIIAKTGMANQADKKGDKNKSSIIKRSLEKLKEKLNIESNEVINSNDANHKVQSVNIQNPSATYYNHISTKSPEAKEIIENNLMTKQPDYKVTTLSPKMYENLNKLIKSGKYQRIEEIYQQNKSKIDSDPALLSLYYESKYKAKKIHDSLIPAQIIDVNARLKTSIISSKILRQKQ